MASPLSLVLVAVVLGFQLALTGATLSSLAALGGYMRRSAALCR